MSSRPMPAAAGSAAPPGTLSAFDRERADAALARSEQHYRTLFDSIDQGLCIIEVLFDAQGNAEDYRFLQMNAAFERQTGLVNAVGERMRALEPGHEPFWFEVYGQIARTGESRRFEHVASALNRHFDVFAFRIGAPEEHQVAILFNDISERKRHEANLIFLADITRDLVHLSSVDGTLQRLGAKIGAHLQVSRCDLADVNEAGDEIRISHGWHRDDLPDLHGVYRLPDFLSADALRRWHAGEVLVVHDAQRDPASPPSSASPSYAAAARASC